MDKKGIEDVSGANFIKKKLGSRYEECISSFPLSLMNIIEGQIILSNWYLRKGEI